MHEFCIESRLGRPYHRHCR